MANAQPISFLRKSTVSVGLDLGVAPRVFSAVRDVEFKDVAACRYVCDCDLVSVKY